MGLKHVIKAKVSYPGKSIETSIRPSGHRVNFVDDTWEGNVHVSEVKFVMNIYDPDNVHPPGNPQKSWDGLWTDLGSRIKGSKMSRSCFMFVCFFQGCGLKTLLVCVSHLERQSIV